jgi:hypothetical protein
LDTTGMTAEEVEFAMEQQHFREAAERRRLARQEAMLRADETASELDAELEARASDLALEPEPEPEPEPEADATSDGNTPTQFTCGACRRGWCCHFAPIVYRQ